ncbi:MFS transporter [Cytobacillus oceanisediminis]|uniref:MFS transporter n=1 Tax=Cytobacillus oceanisediminis TaxID=665099 RepID=UPI001D13AA13|nr:MFS transporter [Cytobacillus oceanisediminis]MCC3648483.1 MFS transporter [Cytobacillus oceanisediminis]
MISLFITHVKYRNLVISYSLSVLIDSLLFMSLLKYIELNTESGFQFTLFYILYYLPAALFALFIGAWIEKRTLQKVMHHSIWFRILLMILFLLTSWAVPYWAVFIFIFLEASIAIFYLPANDALVPRIVDKRVRAEANSLVKLLFVVMHIVGFLAAAILIKFHIPIQIIFIISIVALLFCSNRLTKVTPHITGEAEQSTSIKQLTMDGLAYISKKEKVKKVFLLFGCAWLVASSIDIVIIQYLTQIAKTGSEMLGIVGIGTFTGIILGATISPYLYQNVNLKWLFILPLFVYALTIESLSMFNHWLMIIPFFFIGGITLGIYEVIFTTYLQDHVSQKYFARVFSVYNMILNSMPLPGLLFLGTAMKQVGIYQTIHFISLFLLVIGVLAIFLLPSFQRETAAKRGT